MRLNEKWMLFLIATFVTFFGIVDTLVKGTAASELLVDEEVNVAIQDSHDTISKNDRLTGVLSYTIDNCLSSIELSEGDIEFKSMISEYWINVVDFENLEVYPKLFDDSFSYSIEKNINDEVKNVVIKIMDQNNNFKLYTLYVNEDMTDNEKIQ